MLELRHSRQFSVARTLSRVGIARICLGLDFGWLGLILVGSGRLVRFGLAWLDLACFGVFWRVLALAGLGLACVVVSLACPDLTWLDLN